MRFEIYLATLPLNRQKGTLILLLRTLSERLESWVFYDIHYDIGYDCASKSLFFKSVKSVIFVIEKT